jgi:PleD family two-component response regulator
MDGQTGFANAQALIKAADKAMYEAKRDGRDHVVYACKSAGQSEVR